MGRVDWPAGEIASALNVLTSQRLGSPSADIGARCGLQIPRKHTNPDWSFGFGIIGLRMVLIAWDCRASLGK